MKHIKFIKQAAPKAKKDGHQASVPATQKAGEKVAHQESTPRRLKNAGCPVLGIA